MSIRLDIPVILCPGFSEQINEKKANKMGISYLIVHRRKVFDRITG